MNAGDLVEAEEVEEIGFTESETLRESIPWLFEDVGGVYGGGGLSPAALGSSDFDIEAEFLIIYYYFYSQAI